MLSFKKKLFLLLVILVVFSGFFFFKKDFKNPRHVSAQTVVPTPPATDWYMAGANPQRTSWVSEQVGGSGTSTIQVDWYWLFKSFVNGKIQPIVADGKIYISSANGLYVFDVNDPDDSGPLQSGNLSWIFPTEMGLGHSPTVVGNKVYFGGMDHKIYAVSTNPTLTNCNSVDSIDATIYHCARTPEWTFEAPMEGDIAPAGFEVNPLVVNGVVYAGNRNGYMYAINATNGNLLWKYKTGGSIRYSAAYNNDAIYFASMDGYAYALNTNCNNTDDACRLKWKSSKLPGAGFFSYWPVIYNNYVIFSGSLNYVQFGAGNPIGLTHFMEYEKADSGADGISAGSTIPGSLISSYINNPNYSDRRSVMILSRSNGTELTPYAPFFWYETHSGNRYPPVVMNDGNLYLGNAYIGSPNMIPRGGAVKWQFGTTNITGVFNNINAIDEPFGFSGSGNMLYAQQWNANKGQGADIRGGWEQTFFDYGALQSQIPEILDWFTGDRVYENNAKSPFVPYQGKLYSNTNNVLIGWRTTSGSTHRKVGTVPIINASATVATLSQTQLENALLNEIRKFDVDGNGVMDHLRPGYHGQGLPDYEAGNISDRIHVQGRISEYFSNPGETIYTLLLALPHVTDPTWHTKLRDYIQSEWNSFNPCNTAHIGWTSPNKREAYITQRNPQIQMNAFGSRDEFWGDETFWNLPQFNFYAAWKYAEEFAPPTTDPVGRKNFAQQIFSVCQPHFETWPGNDEDLGNYTFFHNAYMAGYLGYAELAKMAGNTSAEAMARNAYNTLWTKRVANFTKHRPPTLPVDNEFDLNGNFVLNAARNFMYLTPETGAEFKQRLLAKVTEAVSWYDHYTPYWYVSKYDATFGEGIVQLLYDYPALFQARAWILGYSREQLTKYLDAPAFERGDLFYIQNLVAAIEAGNACGLSGDIDCSGQVNALDLSKLILKFGQIYSGREDVDGSGQVNALDLAILLANFGK
jgi:hypothetical protein